MYEVYDLMFDYDMAQISDEDYQYLVEKIAHAEAIHDAANSDRLGIKVKRKSGIAARGCESPADLQLLTNIRQFEALA